MKLSNNIKIVLIIVVIAIAAGAFYFVKKGQPSEAAKKVKDNSAPDDPEKFKRYLQEALTPDQLFELRKWRIAHESEALGNPERYQKWRDDAKKKAETLKIPFEVELDRGWLFQMSEAGELSKEEWEKISVDSIYLYR